MPSRNVPAPPPQRGSNGGTALGRLREAIGYSASEPWMRVLAGSRWLVIDRMVRIGFGFFAGIALARFLGPSRFGLFAYATTLGALFQPLVSLGMERIIIRDLVRFPDGQAQLLGTAGLLRLAGGLAGLVLVVGAALWLGQGLDSSPWLVAIIVAGNVFMAADVVDWAFQARGRFGLPVVLRLGVFLAATGLRLYLAAVGASLALIAGTVLLEAAMVGMLLLAAASRLEGAPLRTWRWGLNDATQLLALTWPLLLAEVAIWVFQRMDLVLLKHFVAENEVGWYASAVRIIQTLQFVPMVAVQVISPEVARVVSTKDALALTGKAMTVLVALAYGITLSICLLAPRGIPFLFGQAYAPSVPLVMVMAGSTVFTFLGSCHAMYLVSVDLQRISLYLTWNTAVLSLVLNVLIIPRWHGMGAAVASLATYSLTALFGVMVFKGSRPLFRENLKALWAPFRLVRNVLRAP